jgi:hypothetical protein
LVELEAANESKHTETAKCKDRHCNRARAQNTWPGLKDWQGKKLVLTGIKCGHLSCPYLLNTGENFTLHASMITMESSYLHLSQNDDHKRRLHSPPFFVYDIDIFEKSRLVVCTMPLNLYLAHCLHVIRFR